MEGSHQWLTGCEESKYVSHENPLTENTETCAQGCAFWDDPPTQFVYREYVYIYIYNIVAIELSWFFF